MESDTSVRLIDAIKSLRLNPDKAMNALQDAGVVADECVRVDDVPECDQAKAVEFLSKPSPKRIGKPNRMDYGDQ